MIGAHTLTLHSCRILFSVLFFLSRLLFTSLESESRTIPFSESVICSPHLISLLATVLYIVSSDLCPPTHGGVRIVAVI